MLAGDIAGFQLIPCDEIKCETGWKHPGMLS